MSKLAPKIGNGQLNILDLMRQASEITDLHGRPAPGSLNIDSTIRALVSEGIKKTKLSRNEIAAQMSEFLGKDITKTTLDAFSAESKENHRLPVAYLNAFIEATGDKSILHFLCEKAGGHFIQGKDALTLELGKIHERKRELCKEEKSIKELLLSLKASK